MSLSASADAQLLIAYQLRWSGSRHLFSGRCDGAILDFETKTERLKGLAELLLDCSWTESHHQELVLSLAKKESAAVKGLVSELHGRLPYLPSRSVLIQFLDYRFDLLKGIRWNRFAIVQRQRRLWPTVMQPGKAERVSWEIPALPTVASVADELLCLPISLVEWLCNPRVEHYAVTAISKRGLASYRILEQPKQRLKAAQRDILREILRSIPTHPTVHGFVKGRSVVSFAAPHAGRESVLRMDLQDFFPTVDAVRVLALFRSLGYPYSVASSLTSLCTTASSLDHLSELRTLVLPERRRLQSLYGRPHLPQGAPTSPALANLVAFRMDARLQGLASAAGLLYTRYADDLLFSGDRRLARFAGSFGTQVAAIAMEEGFQIQYRKTRLMPQSVRQAAAGVVINQRPNIDRESYDKLKATLTNCVRLGPESQNRAAHRDFRAHLLGRISWVKQLNSLRGEKLFNIFGRIEWRPQRN